MPVSVVYSKLSTSVSLFSGSVPRPKRKRSSYSGSEPTFLDVDEPQDNDLNLPPRPQRLHDHTLTGDNHKQRISCIYGCRQGTPYDYSIAVQSVSSQPSYDDFNSLPLPTISPTNSRSDIATHLSDLFSSSKTRRRSAKRRISPSLRHLTDYCLDSQASWLSIYFVLNLALTLYNKFILVSFPFPYSLTALHALCGAIGGRLLLHNGAYQPKVLHKSDYLVLTAFSILYSVNIAISNVSLNLVTIPVSAHYRHGVTIYRLIRP